MGLTIHYALHTTLTKPSDVRRLVQTLQQHACTLPFKEVSDVQDLRGPAADYEQSGTDDPQRWLKIQALAAHEVGTTHYDVKPTRLIGFSAWPGEGCEDANLGFCTYPAAILPTDGWGRQRRFATHLRGWRWKSFCKTQYASDPTCGGVAHFLRCHLCVIQLLDFAHSTGQMTIEVDDEGGYWQHHDVEKLAREVGQWNQHIAALAGVVKDAVACTGMDVASAIARYPNFEHLEAKGTPAVQRLRDALGS